MQSVRERDSQLGWILYFVRDKNECAGKIFRPGRGVENAYAEKSTRKATEEHRSRRDYDYGRVTCPIKRGPVFSLIWLFRLAQ